MYRLRIYREFPSTQKIFLDCLKVGLQEPSCAPTYTFSSFMTDSNCEVPFPCDIITRFASFLHVVW